MFCPSWVPFFAPPVAESDSPNCGKSSAQQAIFRVNVTLSIPNIAMVPALEEVQQALNRAVECVVSVSKGVGQWSKERISKVGDLMEQAIIILTNEWFFFPHRS